jgi:hypothetical protein
MPGTKNVADLAIILAQVEPVSITDDYSGRILTTMLQHQQRIVDYLGNRILGNYSNYSTHNVFNRAVV